MYSLVVTLRGARGEGTYLIHADLLCVMRQQYMDFMLGMVMT